MRKKKKLKLEEEDEVYKPVAKQNISFLTAVL